MRTVGLGPVIVASALLGCGDPPAPDAYLEDFAVAYCDLWVSCADPAQLAFDGQSADTCLAENGPRFEEQWRGCKLDAKQAEQCLANLGGTACPPEGAEIDGAMPLECTTAWEKCAP